MGFFDNSENKSSKGNDAIRPCPECGADEVYIAERGWWSGTYRCDNCEYEPERDEVARGLFETIQQGFDSEDITIEEARTVASQMEQDIDPNELLSPINPKLKSPLTYLDDDEMMKFLFKGIDVDVDGDDAGHRSYTIITDKRVIIATAGFLGKATRHSISYHNITDVSMGGRIASVLEIRTAGHEYEITGFSGKVAKACFEYIREQVERGGAKSNSSDEEDPFDKLERLAKLKEEGIISQEEFETKKQELLDDV